MKEVKKFIIVDLIVMLLKVLGGLLTHSYTLLATAIYDLLLIVILLFSVKAKDNKKYKSIITGFISFLIILLSIGLVFISFVTDAKVTSLFILLFLIVSFILRYTISTITTNTNFQRRRGLLTIANMNSSFDFILFGAVLIEVIVGKFSFLWKPLIYADRIGVTIVSLLVIYRALKIIVNGFKSVEGIDLSIDDTFKEEISNRDEVKKISSVTINSYGGIRYLKLGIDLDEKLTIMDLNSFVITLQDFLLKKAEIVRVEMTNGVVKKKTRVRSKKEDARNSGSRNSKTNTKKKNTKKKNNKR